MFLILVASTLVVPHLNHDYTVELRDDVLPSVDVGGDNSEVGDASFTRLLVDVRL